MNDELVPALETTRLPTAVSPMPAVGSPSPIGATVTTDGVNFCLFSRTATGVELLRRAEPRLVPWAWAVNGLASVSSSVLAVVLAMVFGFDGVAIAALAIYCVGTLSLVSVLPALDRAPAR